MDKNEEIMKILNLFLTVVIISISLISASLDIGYETDGIIAVRIDNLTETCSSNNYIYSIDFKSNKILCRDDGLNGSTISGSGKSGDPPYLYNNSNTMFFNETQLNATIDDRATGLGDNASWNESYANNIYLLLDASNDPLTGTLTTQSIEADTGGDKDIGTSLNSFDDGYIDRVHVKEQLVMAVSTVTGNLIPTSHNTYSIGTSGIRWQNIFTGNIAISTILSMGASSTVSGNLIPFTDNSPSMNLGTSANRWRSLWVGDGHTNIDKDNACLYLGDGQDSCDAYNSTDRLSISTLNTSYFYFQNYTDVCDDDGKCMSAIGSGSGGVNYTHLSNFTDDINATSNQTTNTGDDVVFNEINSTGNINVQPSTADTEGFVNVKGNNQAGSFVVEDTRANAKALSLTAGATASIFQFDSDNGGTFQIFHDTHANTISNPGSGTGVFKLYSTGVLELLGASSTLWMSPVQGAVGDISTGSSITSYGTNEALNLIADAKGGTAGAKVAGIAYTGSDWVSIWEFENEVGGISPNFTLTKSGGWVNVEGDGLLVNENITADSYCNESRDCYDVSDFLSSGDNASWNESYANTLYSGLEWGYNQSIETFNMWNSTWDDGLTEDKVEAYIFDNDNTANQNMSNYNITGVQCIVFQSGGSWCTA